MHIIYIYTTTYRHILHTDVTNKTTAGGGRRPALTRDRPPLAGPTRRASELFVYMHKYLYDCMIIYGCSAAMDGV